MKEFESKFGNIEEAYESCGWRDIGEWEGMKEGWKAALEWVYNHPLYIKSNSRDFIKEELNE